MRWALAVGVLTLVALTSPIAAGDKRSAALAVRVTVVRSCSVSTDPVSPARDAVNCGTRVGPPVMRSTSMVTMPSPQRPAVRIESTPLPSDEPAAVRGNTSRANAIPRAQTPQDAGNSADIPARDRGPAAGADDHDAPDNPPGASIRLLTVNF